MKKQLVMWMICAAMLLCLAIKLKAKPTPPPSIAKFNSVVAKGNPTPAQKGQTVTANGAGASVWAFVKGSDIDSGDSSSGMVLLADGNGKAAFGSSPAAPTALPPNGPAGGDLMGTYPNPFLSIGVVSTAKIADGAVTADKLAPGVLPTALPPNGNAGGDLSGTYPNPAIADSAVTAAKLAPGVLPTTLPPNGNAGGDLTGTYPNPAIADGAVTGTKIAPAQVVKSFNALTDDVLLAPGANITITPTGNTLTIASTGAGASGIWSVNNNNAYYTAGNVGIGTTTPAHHLSIIGGPAWTSNGWGGAVELANASAIGWRANVGGQRFGIGQTNGGLYFFRTTSDPGTTVSPANYAMEITDAGTVGIGTTTAPGAALEVNGVVRSTRSGNAAQYLQLDGGDPASIRLTAQSIVSAEKNLLIQNLSGEATPGAFNNISFVLGTTAAPSAKMTITGGGHVLMTPGGSGGTIEVGSPNGESGFAIYSANRADLRFDGNTVKLLAGVGAAAMPSTNGITVDTSGKVNIGTNVAYSARLNVVSADTNPAVFVLGGNTSSTTAGDGVSSHGGNGGSGDGGTGTVGLGGTSAGGKGGIGAINFGGNSSNGAGGLGTWGVGGSGGGFGGGAGIHGQGGDSSNTNYGGGTGVEAYGGQSTGNATGGGALLARGGDSTNGIGGMGIFVNPGNGPLGTSSAGIFNGNVTVNGSVSKYGGSFKIDHPLDPANKYLSHSFVESPDMMNIYNGNVTTNAAGYATIGLPDYFAALNKDFRYQLTVIGQFAQAIVSQEIKDNQFTIQTDKPNVKVSWQVTGVRQDAWANAHRIPVEENKEKQDTYLCPELFGQPALKHVEWARNPELMRQITEGKKKDASRGSDH